MSFNITNHCIKLYINADLIKIKLEFISQFFRQIYTTLFAEYFLKYRPQDKEEIKSLKTESLEAIKINEITTSAGDTLTDSIITPRNSPDLALEEEFGGPSLLINDIIVPSLIERKDSVFEIVTNPRFEICFMVNCLS